MKKILYLFSLLFITNLSYSQGCSSGESTVIIQVFTDNYGYETYWTLTGSSGTVFGQGGQNGVYTNATLYADTFCVPNSECTRFSIHDTYGDGICCAYGTGYYNVIVNGVTIATGGNFTTLSTVDFNCPPGSTCLNADSIAVGGPYSTVFDNHWYRFVPTANGIYNFTTCNLNTCDTKIWIYDNCGAIVNETNVGTVFYDDNSCGVGSTQAIVNAAMAAGTVYYIRIGDSFDDCSNPVSWSLQYQGPITGCTDPTACNYNPLATVSDTCIYPGNPLCPTGPDLLLREDVLRNSMYVDVYNSVDNCMVAEECIRGLGSRQLIRFTTHIENNGTQDYFIGNPSSNPGQFSTNNCHGHTHYEGYAEYILYDQNRSPIPAGFKSGFCVMDLICQHGGTAQYGCSNMGISHGCGDIYDASLDCQWIDITNVPDGVYTFVAKVNWDYSPDALGRYELSYTNNWGQVCFTLSRASGTPQITINPNCPVFVDCAGQPFGNAVPDCNGVCNGNALMGNLNSDTVINNTDLNLYLNGIVDNSLTATNCNDLHRDTSLTVFDAALLNQCLRDTNNCNFPNGIVNIFDTAYLSIGAVDFTNQYVDIYLRNPDNKVIAYEFTMSGIVIDSVQSLVANPNSNYWSASTSKVLALSLNDSSVNRTNVATPLCRVYFSSINGNLICIESIQDIVSDAYQALIPRIEGPCFSPSSIAVNQADYFELTVQPNPVKESTTFNLSRSDNSVYDIEIYDLMGRLVEKSYITENSYTFYRNQLAAGVYYYKVGNKANVKKGKIVLE
jgi:hypothetical protein